MNNEEQIDSTLRLLGSVTPPPELETRVRGRLAEARRRKSPVIHRVSILALAASLVLAAAALNPTLRGFATRTLNLDGKRGAPAAHVGHATGSFGPASAVHVPVTPMQVAPTPVAQGRGRGRSHHGAQPQVSRAPLPQGVATSAQTHLAKHQPSVNAIPR